MGSLDSDCSGLKGLWMYASVGICAACGVMLHTFFHLFCVDDFVHCFNGLFRHLTTAQQDITVCAMCYAISRSPFILLWWNFFFPKCLHIDPKEHHSCWCKTGWLRCNRFIVIFYFLFLYLFIYLFLFWDFQKWRCDLYLKYTMLLLLLQIETMIIHPRMMSLRASSSDILESKRFIKKKKDAWRVCNIRFFMLARDPNNTLCSLLSHSAHWPSATPQWCRPALAFLLACIAWWMRKNDCDISYRFRINASGSNAAPDTLISILVVTGEHKKGEACAALKNGWGVLLKWLPVYNLVFSQREGIMYSKTLW